MIIAIMEIERFSSGDGESRPEVSAAPERRSVMARIYTDNFQRVYSYCLKRLYLHDAAEEVTAQVFLCLVESIDRFVRSDPNDVKNWLYGVARHLVFGHIRNVKKRNKIAATIVYDRAKGADRVADNINLDWPRVCQALFRLKPRQQDFIIFRFFEGLSSEEIAAIMGMKPGTVRIGLMRALREIRKSLGNDFWQPEGGKHNE